jgi:cobalt-zinc-cadmium efflux system outer membrane protein
MHVSPLIILRKSSTFGVALAAFVLFTSTAQLSGQSAPLGNRADTVSLSIDVVQRLAIEGNPALLGVRQETAIADGALQQARLFRTNPELVLQSAGATNNARGQLELTATQEVEWAGQRRLRANAATAGLSRATFSVRDAGRVTVADASRAYFRAFAAQRRLAVAQEARTLVERLLAAVQIQMREGEISTLEANLAEIEEGRARAKVLSAQRVATNAELELKLTLGLAAGVPVKLVGESTVLRSTQFDGTTVDSLVALSIARRTDLAASAEAVREAEVMQALSRREALPNVRLGVVAIGNGGNASMQFGPAIGLTLPFFNRQQGLVSQRRARLDQALFEQRATLLRVRTDVVSAERAFRAASAEAQVYETSVVQRAHENSALLETAYNAGKIGLSNFLLLRNQLLDAELGYWDAWLEQREALVRLEAATGVLTPSAAELPPVKPTGTQPMDATTPSSRIQP